MQPTQHDTVLVLDFGSPFTQMLARRVRSTKIYCRVLPPCADRLRQECKKHTEGIKGVILSGQASAQAISDLRQAASELGLKVLECSDPQTCEQSALESFLLQECAARADWEMGSYVQEAVAQIRQSVGDKEVVLGLSGGVDSSVAAALIHRAIGQQLTCVFVDHGLLRLNEAQQVLETFAVNLGAHVVHIDASEQFLAALKGVSDPEQKRKIIGAVFVDVFKAEAAKLKNATFLAQGTIYPDVIESGVHGAATIKSHHNVGGLPEQLGLELLEPLRDLFKDEVRELGVALGLPPEMVHRHPFPGPGIGVRILGEIKKEYADILRHADAIFIEELRAAGWYERVSQAFGIFLPVKTVGVSTVNGTAQRTYEYAIALRAVQTIDFMSADSAELPYELLKKSSARIIAEVSGVNRVVYDVSTKPPATIEWE